MSIKCSLGMHNWDGCICIKCNKKRDEGHDWSKDCTKCSQCGETRSMEHDWSQDCEKCINCTQVREAKHDWSKDCKGCSICNETREVMHDWSKDCEKCVNCEKTRKNKHDWSKDCTLCVICGKTKNTQHDWTIDCQKCSYCEKTREIEHQWNGCICVNCKQTRDEGHNWNGCTCLICGSIHDEQHDWSQDCEKCAICGKTRAGYHQGDGEICPLCNKPIMTGTFKDDRDGKVYQWVRIDDQIWMAENMAYKATVGQCWAYDDDEDHVEKYGYLYDWEAAMSIAPKGWHLPTEKEYEDLIGRYGGRNNTAAYNALIKGGKTGFDTIFAGARYEDGQFQGIGDAVADFWSASEYPAPNNSVEFGFCTISKQITSCGNFRNLGFSVRLIKD